MIYYCIHDFFLTLLIPIFIDLPDLGTSSKYVYARDVDIHMHKMKISSKIWKTTK